jgi:hypothetical protein
MGGAAPASLGSINDDAGAPPGEGEASASRSARLYKYDAASAAWSVARASVDVTFVDNAEDEGDASDWHVEVRARGGAELRRRRVAASDLCVGLCCAHARRARVRERACQRGSPLGAASRLSTHRRFHADPARSAAHAASRTAVPRPATHTHHARRWRTCLRALVTT